MRGKRSTAAERHGEENERILFAAEKEHWRKTGRMVVL